MSRAMVSRYLAELERWMGARLLHRTTRRLSPTGPGEEALNRARAMLALGKRWNTWPSAMTRPRGATAHHLQLLSLRSPAGRGGERLPGPLPRHGDRHPAAGPDGQSGGGANRSRPAHHQRPRSQPGGRRLGTCHSVVCASPAYLARHAPPQRVQDLALHNCLTYTYFGKSLWGFWGPMVLNPSR